MGVEEEREEGEEEEGEGEGEGRGLGGSSRSFVRGGLVGGRKRWWAGWSAAAARYGRAVQEGKCRVKGRCTGRRCQFGQRAA
jgi:hypothetical protein